MKPQTQALTRWQKKSNTWILDDADYLSLVVQFSGKYVWVIHNKILGSAYASYAKTLKDAFDACRRLSHGQHL